MNQKNASGKKKLTSSILWAALLLGLVSPFGVYFSMQQGLILVSVICFCLLALAMGLTAWKG
jgi:uncharacterized protein YhhL (DUF1145 family)